MKNALHVSLAALSIFTACAPSPSEVDSLEAREAPASAATVSVTRNSVLGARAEGGSQYSSFYVDAFRSGTTAAPVTTISVFTQEVDPDSEVCVEEWMSPPDGGEPVPYTWCYFARSSWLGAYGVVPSDSFVMTSKAATLEVDLSTIALEYFERCSVDGEAWECSRAAPTGIVSATWRDDGQTQVMQSGVMQQRMGKASIALRGTWRATSAAFDGSILGDAIDGAGSFGRGTDFAREVTIAPRN